MIRRERHAYYRRTAAVAVCCAAAAMVIAAAGSPRLTRAVLPLELAADLGCFWLARNGIAAVKNAEAWFAGHPQA